MNSSSESGSSRQAVSSSVANWIPIVIGTATLFLVTGAVNLQMPLYQKYAEGLPIRNTIATLVFAAYVAGLIPTLLTLGGLSDRIGRRPAMALGLGCSLLATSLMLLNPSLPSLFVARFFQGAGVGLAVSSASAFLAARMDRPGQTGKAVGLVTASTSLGFGGGALFTGTILFFETTLRPWSYWVFATSTALCLLALTALPSEQPAGGRLMRLPFYTRATVRAALSIGLAWAVTGIVISLIPAQLARQQLAPWAGHALFLVNATGALVQPLARRFSSDNALRIGFLLLPVGYGCLLWGAIAGLLPLVLLGGAVAGSSCYGFTYVGGLGQVSAHSTLAERARAVAGYFLAAYLGFGLPAVGLGVLADRFGIATALGLFGGVLTLASFGLLASMARPSPAVANSAAE